MSETRMVDKNGMRAGAGISAVALLAGFVVKPDGDFLIPLFAVLLGIPALFGARFGPLGLLYRGVKTLGVKIPVEPEDEKPPRFAQLLGFVFLGLGAFALYGFQADGLAWTLALMVAALQTLLAATGLCVGCEIYLYAKRFTAKAA